MQLIDYIVILVIALIVGGAAAYIIKAKKSGKKCIGCPDNSVCHKKDTNGSSCCSESNSSSSCSGCAGACRYHERTDDTKNA